ncbi:hypothetical protein JXC34_04100 [Candidatus Woesearchaeota archaeon]|nr:hypothetical protein [Candidatus Woesearchaeota archaeon]
MNKKMSVDDVIKGVETLVGKYYVPSEPEIFDGLNEDPDQEIDIYISKSYRSPIYSPEFELKISRHVTPNLEASVGLEQWDSASLLNQEYKLVFIVKYPYPRDSNFIYAVIDEKGRVGEISMEDETPFELKGKPFLEAVRSLVHYAQSLYSG